MNTRLLRRASAGALALTLIGATAAFADNLIPDGDHAIPVSNNALTLGNICAGESTSGSALLAIDRVGGGQTFANSATVTVALDTEGANTTTTLTDSSIVLPYDWTTKINNTLSTDTASALVTVDTVGLSVSANPYFQTVKFQATGAKAGGGSVDRPGNLTVTFKVIECAPSNGEPTAAFTFTPAIPDEGESVTFTDESTDPDGDATIQSWAWAFGDGSTSTDSSPSHTYLDNGSYQVCLTVTDDEGAESAPACQNVAVTNVAPTIDSASFGPNKLKCGTDNATLEVRFSDPGTNDTHTISVDWDNDGVADYTGSATSPVSLPHTYGPGVHTATITVTDNDGGAADVNASVEVLQTYATTFLAPFDGSSPSNLVTNTMKNGRVVPVKIKLYDECALSYVTDPTEVVTIGVSDMGQTSGSADAVEIYADAGQSSAGTNRFRWSTDGFWIYNLDSKILALTTGSTYRVNAYVDSVKATTDTWALLRPVK